MARPSDRPGPVPTGSEHSLQGMDEQCIQEILPLSQVLRYRKYEEIMVKGTDSPCLYYVQEGAVEVSHSLRDTKIAVALIGAGNFFGEIGFFDGVSRVRDIRATEDTVIRVLDQKTLQKTQEGNPALYARFVTFLAQSICAKFRRVLEEREPLTAYAASLSTGRRSYEESKPLPERLLRTSAWTSINKIVEDTKALFFDLSYQLQQDSAPGIPEALQKQCHEILDNFNDRLQEFKEQSAGKPEVEEYAWGYVFKEIFPYFMRSRFAERAYYKPKGYAGDYLMMEMIYRDQPEGDGKLGTLTDSWCLSSAAAKAVRGRRELLCNQLESLCRQKRDQGNPIRIMNLACGSNRELFDFLARCDYTEAIEATCIDADPQALTYTDQQVNNFAHHASIRLMNDNVVKWAAGGMRHDYGLQDIIYSAGLTDYLDRRLFQALVTRSCEHLKPGGVLIIGNFSTKNRNRVFMDHILHWKLIHRDPADLEELFAATPFGSHIEILVEEQEVNLFAVATKI
jgi:extracellular factor (EF) 3-hydroxypalmitic acid methyl ester biosynthesis protein